MHWHRQSATLLGLVLGMGLLGGCSSSPPPIPVEAAATGGVAGGGAPVEDIASYKLGPGDALRVPVFRHEDLSGECARDGEG